MTPTEAAQVPQEDVTEPPAPAVRGEALSPVEIDYNHGSLRLHAFQLRATERVRIETQQRVAKLEFLPEMAIIPITTALDELKRIQAKLHRDMPKLLKGSRLGAWIEETHGIATSTAFLLGNLPPIIDFRTPSAVWKYCGLDVVDGHAPRPKKGEPLGYNAELKAYAIARIAMTIVKVGGPYRNEYDYRRSVTMLTRPPMYEGKELLNPECATCVKANKAGGADCARYGGRHWTDGHRHMDALRFTAKAVILDAWRVARDLRPHLGARPRTGTDHLPRMEVLK